MYERFFGFDRRPFASAPDADCYFPGTSIEAARQTLFRCLERGEGAGVLIGPAGTGKSLLLQVLSEQFTGRASTVILNSGGLSTRRATACRRSYLNWDFHTAKWMKANCDYRSWITSRC